MNSNLNTAKAVNAKTTSNGSSRARNAKLTKELQDHISQLRTELSVEHSNNLTLLHRKTQELKKAQGEGGSYNDPSSRMSVSASAGQGSSAVGVSSSVRKPNLNNLDVTRFGETFILERHTADGDYNETETTMRPDDCDGVDDLQQSFSFDAGELDVADHSDGPIANGTWTVKDPSKSLIIKGADAEVNSPNEDEKIAELTAILERTLSSSSSRQNTAPACRNHVSKTDPRNDKENEKHWQLQKKVFDLTSQMSQMEKRITALKEENELLKKKGEELKASDEKVKQLKKRNAELAGIARKLEDRLKQFNSDTNKQKKRDSSSPSHESLTSMSRNGKLPAKENTKISNDKDKTIEILRDKCQELIRLLTAQQSSCSIEPSIESSQLAVVIKQAAKERLLLEKQLADVQRVDPVVEAQLERAAQLEDQNANLENEVSQLSAELAEKEKLEIEVIQKRVEVEMLDKEISETKLHCGKLEKDLNDALVTNSKLAAEKSDLQQQLADLERIRAQYEVLETQLKKSEQEASATKTEMNKLRTNFSSLQQQVQAVNEEKVKLEADKDAAAMQMNQKQLQIDELMQLREEERKEHANKMTSLESRVSQMEEQCRQHEVEKLSMTEEIERLRDLCARQQQRVESVQKVPQKSLVNNDEDAGNAEHGQDFLDQASTIVNHVLEPVELNEMAVPSEDARQCASNTSRTSGMVYVNEDAVEPACDDGLEDEERSVAENTTIDQANQSLPVSVFAVLYDYDPHESSPNENPDLELELRAGDYVFIYGDMDEDGFFEGELADGRRGLVPSNFVSQIPPEEAAELFALMAMQSAQGDSTCLLQSSLLSDSNATSLLQAFGSSMDEINNMVSANQLSGGSLADAPLNVQIESGPDHGSLIVNWLPVTLSSAGTSNGLLVKGYWVLVNGVKIKLVPNPTGDHVLLEHEDLCNVDCPKYVTVRTVTVSGQESQDSPRAFLSQQLIQDLTTGLLSTSQVFDSVEDAKRYTPRSDVVHRPIPQLASKHLSSAAAEQSVAVAAESRRSDVQTSAAAGQLQSKSATASFTDVSRSTSDVRADKASSSVPHRANTVPPGLKTHVSSVIETCSGNETVECPVEVDCSLTESAVDEKAEVGRSYGINVHKQMAQSLIELSGSGSSSQQIDDNHSKQMHSSSPSNNLHQSTLSAVGNQSLMHSVACSMTALDSALTSTYFQEVRPSNVTIGGGGVWRRVKPQNSGSSSSGGAFSGPVRTVLNGTESPPDEGMSFIKPVRGAVPVHSQTGTVTSNNDGVEIKKVTAFVVVSKNDEARGENSAVALTSDLSEVEDMAALDVANDSSSDALCQDLDERRQRKLEMAADVEDDTTRQTISELFDNNVVTSHHLRDDIPDSELIDYSDDGGESLVDNSLSMNGGQEQVRIFVALFDYDPSTMSPNPDAMDVEIPFREGQIMLIYGDQDADGFYIGECNGHRGLVPSNMVSLVEVDDPDLALQLLRDGSQSAIANGSVSSSRASSRTSGVTTRTVSTVSQQGDRDVSLPADGPVRYMIAIYSYDPQELSPNIDADQELKFERGQVIAVYGDVDDDGFYYGEVDGRCGLVPSNFVQDAPIKFIAASSSS